MRSTISLLPKKMRQKHSFQKRKYIYIAICIVIASSLAITTLFFQVARLTTRNEWLTIQQRQNELNFQINERKEYEKLDQSIKTLETYIANAAGNTPEWDSLLVEISNSMPGGVWLNDMIPSGLDGNYTIVLRGTALSHTGVSEWIAKLKTMGSLADIKCAYSTAQQDGSNGIAFELSANIIRPTQKNSMVKAGNSNEKK